VPLKVDGMLVVGRSASFDSLPHGSARVVPLGMATGEAAGAAAKLAIEKGISFRELAYSEPDIAELRNRLKAQGMDLDMPKIKTPDYARHPAYPGLLAAVSMSLTYGNYDNKQFDLDGFSNAMRYAYSLSGVKRVHKDKFAGNALDAVADIADPAKTMLTLEQAAYTMALTAGLDASRSEALGLLLEKGWIRQSTIDAIGDRQQLTNGDAFMLIRDLVELYVGVKYE